jgi:hypothetical protein
VVGAATVLHRRGGRAVVAVSVGVAGGVPNQQRFRASERSRETAASGPPIAEAGISLHGWFSGEAEVTPRSRSGCWS